MIDFFLAMALPLEQHQDFKFHQLVIINLEVLTFSVFNINETSTALLLLVSTMNMHGLSETRSRDRRGYFSFHPNGVHHFLLSQCPLWSFLNIYWSLPTTVVINMVIKQYTSSANIRNFGWEIMSSLPTRSGSTIYVGNITSHGERNGHPNQVRNGG